MTTLAQATGKTGTVQLGDKELTVGAMSQADEDRLFARLRDALKQQVGSYYKANRAMIDDADPRDRAVIVETLTRMEASQEPASPRAVLQFRRTPKGCALELFVRAKKYHPEISLKEVEAVITDANSYEVAAAIEDAIAAEDASGKGSTPSPSPQ